MTLADHNLSALLRQLSGRDKAAVEEMLVGKRTDEAQVILRWLRKRLKRVARSKKRRR